MSEEMSEEMFEEIAKAARHKNGEGVPLKENFL